MIYSRIHNVPNELFEYDFKEPKPKIWVKLGWGYWVIEAHCFSCFYHIVETVNSYFVRS